MFVDESGFQLPPVVRKTGQTPVLANWDRHDRITAVTALAWTPATNHMQLYFELLPHNAKAFDFL